MAKELNVTPISDTAQMPIKKGTLQFIQDAWAESLDDFTRAVYGSPINLNPIVLWGCINSGSGLTYNISEGAVLHIGRVYKVDAVSFTASAGQTAIWSIATTQYTTNADPVTFTDGSINNVHNIKKIAIAAAAPSTFFLYSNFIFYNWKAAQPDASETVKGILKLATQALTNAGVNDLTAVTPLKLVTLLNASILGAWTLRQNTADVTVTGGSGTSVAACGINYRIVGKTMHINFGFTVSNTTAPTSFSLLIPGGKQSAVSGAILASVTVLDGSTNAKYAIGLIPTSGTLINITLGVGVSLTNGTSTSVLGTVTFEIV